MQPKPESNHDAQWQFKPESGESPPPPTTPRSPEVATVEWTASEFVAHVKGSGWYLILIISTTALVIVAYLMTKDIFSIVAIILVAIIFGYFAGRQPRVLKYGISNSGIHVEDKTYHYEMFKSFAVIEDDAVRSIMLMPMKRFMPALTIYYAPEDEEKIINALSAYLPVQQHQSDALDRLMRKIRF